MLNWSGYRSLNLAAGINVYVCSAYVARQIEPLHTLRKCARPLANPRIQTQMHRTDFNFTLHFSIV